MHSCDVIAYTVDGACYCDECGAQYDDGGENTDCSPVFADNESAVFGWTCDDCLCCYVIGVGWYSREDATNPAFTRWATCRECNAQYPFSTGHGFTRARRDALCGRLYCYSCGKHSLHF